MEEQPQNLMTIALLEEIVSQEYQQVQGLISKLQISSLTIPLAMPRKSKDKTSSYFKEWTQPSPNLIPICKIKILNMLDTMQRRYKDKLIIHLVFSWHRFFLRRRIWEILILWQGIVSYSNNGIRSSNNSNQFSDNLIKLTNHMKWMRYLLHHKFQESFNLI